ncbi:hypothetical protein SS50377_23451 [Spironucleus salmonicida]|uniref:Uncharacterized protein n=1 Tax=Spironucleus salmonicida TaxID=348837 RepID=V6LPN6_9EUKA|nr:hypothetical protein SS50377_23451 [Spironucleus salmonicida]|eukprot:EST46188.1 hypothetical protein SS50377_13783 [Spironucleus salmonicida]
MKSIFRYLFKTFTFVMNLSYSLKARIVYYFDKFHSLLYPYVLQKPIFEFVPNHLVLTGGLISTSRRGIYLKKLAQFVSHSYDLQIDLITLFLPYSKWYINDVFELQKHLQQQLMQLGYHPLITILSGEQTVEIDQQNNEIYENPNLQLNDEENHKNIIVVIAAPNVIPSKLQSSNLLIQLVDDRLNDYNIKQILESQPKTVDQMISQLPGMSLDSSGYFNRQVDLLINFGTENNQTVEGIPFWFLRKSLIYYTENINKMELSSFWRVLHQFSQAKSRKKIILKDE